MELTEAHYTVRETAALLGISRNRVWRLKQHIGFTTRTRGMDRRVKWLSADTVRELHAYLHQEMPDAD